MPRIDRTGPGWTLAPGLLVALGLVAGSPPARADQENRDFIPFGERAAMLGNAGITSAAGEAVYYNPANLARVERDDLSVSGSTYLSFHFSVDPFLVIQGEDQPFDASGFEAVPASVISTHHIAGFTVATAVLVPDAFTTKNRVTLESADVTGTILESLDEQSLWLGAGAGRHITPDLSVGVSVFASRETQSQITFFRIAGGTAPMQQVSEQLTSTDVTVYNLSAVAGVTYQRPAVTIGARVFSPTLRLAGSEDAYSSGLTDGTTMDGGQEVHVEGVRASQPYPADLGAGIAVRPAAGLELVLDAGLQLPGTFTLVDDPTLGRDVLTLDAAPRVGLGLEWQASSQLALRLGGMFNGSAAPEPKEGGDTRENYVGATGGLAFESGRTTIGLGAFYLHAFIHALVVGVDPPEKAQASGSVIGGLLAISYRL